MTTIKDPEAVRTCKHWCKKLRYKSPGFCNGTYYCNNTEACHYGHLFNEMHPICERVVPHLAQPQEVTP